MIRMLGEALNQRLIDSSIKISTLQRHRNEPVLQPLTPQSTTVRSSQLYNRIHTSACSIVQMKAYAFR